MIDDWYLYANGQVISEGGMQGVGANGENQLVFDVLFRVPDDLTNLVLVPVYQDRQPHTEEAIYLISE